MKKALLFIAILSFYIPVFGQAPQAFSYQAVIRNSEGQIVSDEEIQMQVSITSDISGNNIVYSEVKNPITSEDGLVSIEFGTGETTNGNFSEIDWADGPLYIKTEIDINGGNDYTISTISQLLSVPYALYARSAETITGEIEEIDGSVTNELQNLEEVLVHGNDAGDNQIKNIAEPTDDKDAVTKAYVDALIERIKALEVKDSIANSKFSDPRDGKVYKMVTIGTQTWMAENLAYLPEVHTASQCTTKIEEREPFYAVYGYDGSSVTAAKGTENYRKYGVLYNWFAVNEADICPAGWHVPGLEEWEALDEYIQSMEPEGEELRTGLILRASSGWDENDERCIDKYGFSALPAGARMIYNSNGPDMQEGAYTYWWTSTEYSYSEAKNADLSYAANLYNHDSHLFINHTQKNQGFSVRCVKD